MGSDTRQWDFKWLRHQEPGLTDNNWFTDLKNKIWTF